MSSRASKRVRPGWFVDAKWIFGILFSLTLTVSLLLFGFVQLTEKETALQIMSKSLALVFSSNGLDDANDIESYHVRLADSPDGIEPVDGLKLTITAEEIEGQTPREARMSIYRKIAEPVYENGKDGLTQFADTPEMVNRLNSISSIGVLTAHNHQLFANIFYISGAITLLFMALFIFFSYRFGRVGNVGLVIAVFSLPPGAACTLLATMQSQTNFNIGAEEKNTQAMFGYFASNLAPPFASGLARYYLLAVAFGLFLILVALLGSMIFKIVERHQSV